VTTTSGKGRRAAARGSGAARRGARPGGSGAAPCGAGKAKRAKPPVEAPVARSETARRAHSARRAAARRWTRRTDLDALFLRLGLAFVLAYAALTSFTDPSRFERYLPAMLAHPWIEHWCLPVFAAFELVLATALVTGRRLRAAALLSALTIGSITLVNPGHFDVLFRNVAVTCAALALAVRPPAPGPDDRLIVLPD